MKTYAITLADGTKIEHLELNGNNFVTDQKIDDAVFTAENLATVKISDGTTEVTYENMRFIKNDFGEGKSWFVLREKTSQELALERLGALISKTNNSITSIEEAMAEIYENMLGGAS